MATGDRETVTTGEEIAALRRLIDDVAGPGAGDAVPLAAPLLLFSRLDAERRGALFDVGPGRVLVQEHLALDNRRRIRPDEPIVVNGRIHPATSPLVPVRIEAEMVDRDAAVIAEVRTALRSLPAESLAASRGPSFGRGATDDAAVRRTTRPLTPDLVGRWVDLVGDDNPIHVDAGFARGLGLDGPVVPGALLTAAAEALAGPLPATGPIRLNMRFTAPIRVGRTVEVEIRPRAGRGDPNLRDLRLLFAVDDRVAAVADLSLG